LSVGYIRAYWIVLTGTEDKAAQPGAAGEVGLGLGGFEVHGYYFSCVVIPNRLVRDLIKPGRSLISFGMTVFYVSVILFHWIPAFAGMTGKGSVIPGLTRNPA